MALFDWDAYRAEAGRQTAALNHTPGVADPAALTNDPAVNQEYLYGKDNRNNLMPGVYEQGALEMFKAEVQKMVGRPPTQDEINGFIARFANEGGTSRGQSQQIAGEVRDAQAAKAGGQDADSPTASSQVPVGFTAGMLGYPYLPTGQNGFGGGLMGGNLLGGGFAGYRDPFTASN